MKANNSGTYRNNKAPKRYTGNRRSSTPRGTNRGGQPGGQNKANPRGTFDNRGSQPYNHAQNSFGHVACENTTRGSKDRDMESNWRRSTNATITQPPAPPPLPRASIGGTIPPQRLYKPHNPADYRPNQQVTSTSQEFPLASGRGNDTPRKGNRPPMQWKKSEAPRFNFQAASEFLNSRQDIAYALATASLDQTTEAIDASGMFGFPAFEGFIGSGRPCMYDSQSGDSGPNKTIDGPEKIDFLSMLDDAIKASRDRNSPINPNNSVIGVYPDQPLQDENTTPIVCEDFVKKVDQDGQGPIRVSAKSSIFLERKNGVNKHVKKTDGTPTEDNIPLNKHDSIAKKKKDKSDNHGMQTKTNRLTRTYSEIDGDSTQHRRNNATKGWGVRQNSAGSRQWTSTAQGETPGGNGSDGSSAEKRSCKDEGRKPNMHYGKHRQRDDVARRRPTAQEPLKG
eukprot:GHVO01014440.1.p1 GENE.GHVO01014440.1~~GHVO01014440.1.p1  ORF type:complete len:452 (+),score=58.78 GHVO01014440.1:86-1441(+)